MRGLGGKALVMMCIMVLLCGGRQIRVSDQSGSVPRGPNKNVPFWPDSLFLAASTALSWTDVPQPQRSRVWLYWDQRSDGYRVDSLVGDSQLVVSTLILYGTRRAYATSPNASGLCSVYCLPPRVSSLPPLRVATNDTRGSTRYVGDSSWLRMTNVGPDVRNGLYNASVLTRLPSPSRLEVTANYTLHGKLVAQSTCKSDVFESSASIDPALLLPPPACLGVRPQHCFAPLALFDPFPVAQGCFFAEALAPFGVPPSAPGCSCHG